MHAVVKTSIMEAKLDAVAAEAASVSEGAADGSHEAAYEGAGVEVATDGPLDGESARPAERAPGVCSRRFGVADGHPTRVPLRAILSRSASAAVRLKRFFSSSAATTPDTCGALMEVPLMVREAVRPAFEADRMFSPGAAMSVHLPVFEKKASPSVGVLAATVTTPDFSADPPAAAGEK
jgi:hypothetical protein